VRAAGKQNNLPEETHTAKGLTLKWQYTLEWNNL
jgi:hypothetical protein